MTINSYITFFVVTMYISIDYTYTHSIHVLLYSENTEVQLVHILFAQHADVRLANEQWIELRCFWWMCCGTRTHDQYKLINHLILTLLQIINDSPIENVQ